MDRADLRHFLNIRFFAPLASRSGYGTLARGFAKGLQTFVPDIKHHMLRDFPGGTLKLSPQLASRITEPTDDKSPLIRLDVPWRKTYLRYGSDQTAMYTMFEASPIPHDWIVSFSGIFDQIIVPSRFCRELFADAGLENVAVIRPGVRLDLYHPEVDPLRMETRSFVVLFVGEFNYRKGWDLAIRSFARAFNTRDDVTLIIKTWSPVFREEQIRDTIHKTMISTGSPTAHPHYMLLLNMIPDTLMPSLYRAADVLLMPSRSEAYGLPAVEAQACGVPVIATQYGALEEIVSSDYGFLLPIRGMRPVNSSGMTWDFYKGMSFPEPDEDHLVDLLKHLYSNSGVLTDLAHGATNAMRSRSWEIASEEVISLLNQPSGDNYI